MTNSPILDATLRTLPPDKYFWLGCAGLIAFACIGIAFIGLGIWMDIRDAQRAAKAGEL